MTKLAEPLKAGAASTARPRVRGRGWPVALIGVLLVAAGAFGAWTWAGAFEEDAAQPVLVVAQSLPAGHVLAPADLVEVEVASAGLELIGSERAGEVLGRTLALPVSAGTALTPSMLGPSAGPDPGRATTTLALAAGFYPAAVQAGASVIVMAGPGSDPAGEAWQMAAVVRSVAEEAGAALITIEFDAADRAGLAAARGTDVFMVAWTADLPPVEEGE